MILASIAFVLLSGKARAVNYHWSQVPIASPIATVPAIAVAPGNPSVVYASSDNGVFASTDSGATWAKRSEKSDLSTLAVDPTSSSTVWAGSQSGLWKSVDGGRNRARMTVTPTGSFGQFPAYAVAIDPVVPSDRAAGLGETMSRYLIRRLEGNPVIDVCEHTEIVALEGENHLERVSWRDNRTGEVSNHPIRHVFSMTGAVPSTSWLQGCVALDENAFIKTGPDLTKEDLATARWPLARPPHLLETSLPGVFAVGDVRGGNVKRVASAVGEGSIAVSFVHAVLAE